MPERLPDGQIISLDSKELDRVNSFQDAWCSSAALALSEMMNREVWLNAIGAVIQSAQSLNIPQPVCQTTFLLSLFPAHPLVFMFQQNDALVLADILLGGDGSSMGSGTELHTGGAGEIMRTLVGGMSNALTNSFSDLVSILSVETEMGAINLPAGLQNAPAIVQVPLAISIPGVLDAEAWLLASPDFFAPFLTDTAPSQPEAARKDPDSMAVFGSSPQSNPQPAQTMQFAPIGGGPSMSHAPAPAAPSYPAGLNLLMDIPLEVSVELGRVKMLIKDILELGTGSVVELDKVAGEPVDLLVNGKLVAKGEVVVIEDNFGIRVTEILSPMERLSGLRNGE